MLLCSSAPLLHYHQIQAEFTQGLRRQLSYSMKDQRGGRRRLSATGDSVELSYTLETSILGDSKRFMDSFLAASTDAPSPFLAGLSRSLSDRGVSPTALESVGVAGSTSNAVSEDTLPPPVVEVFVASGVGGSNGDFQVDWSTGAGGSSQARVDADTRQVLRGLMSPPGSLDEVRGADVALKSRWECTAGNLDMSNDRCVEGQRDGGTEGRRDGGTGIIVVHWLMRATTAAKHAWA